jgi:hypothetical protein
MAIAVLVIWAATAVVGAYLLFLRISQGGLRQQATRITVFPAAVIFAHPVLALSGFGCWLGYLLTGQATLAWCAFGLLCLTGLLGFVMFTRWLVGRGGRHARGAEEGLPLAAVLVHGTVGLTTFVLVLVVAELASRH